MEWNKETVLSFIHEIKERPIIWDPLCPDHKNQRKRNNAIEEVAMLIGTTSKEVISKWAILRKQFSREKKKNNGWGGDPNYTSKWFAYQEMEPIMTRCRSIVTLNKFEDLYILGNHDSYYKEETQDMSPESGMKSNPSSHCEVYLENMEDEDSEDFERNSVTSESNFTNKKNNMSRINSHRNSLNSIRMYNYHRDCIRLKKLQTKIRILELRNKRKWLDLGSRGLDLFERFVDKYCEC